MKEYISGVTIRDLKESDREKFKGLNFDHMLEEKSKIIETENLFVVINKYDYEQYGKEKLCKVVYIEHSDLLDEDFLKVDFAQIANDNEFNKPLTIEVEFVCNVLGTNESIFKRVDKNKYYMRLDNARESCAKWYTAFKKNDTYHDNVPVRTNVTFKMGDETEKVTFSNWDAEGVYSKDYNKAFSYNELKKSEIAKELKKLAKTFKFKIDERDNDVILCAKNTDKEWSDWIIYEKDTGSVYVTGNTDQCNFWFCNTRKDLTPENIITFVDELNNILADTEYHIPLKILIDPEDWQEIADVQDAYEDFRYSGELEEDELDKADEY